MIAIVTILFGLSWLPIHLIHFFMKFTQFDFCSKLVFAFKTLAHTLTYSNSMLNPFFYTIMGNNFRKQVFEQKAKYSSRFKTNHSRSSSYKESLRLNLKRNIDSVYINHNCLNKNMKRVTYDF